jgi:hypothetical protein
MKTGNFFEKILIATLMARTQNNVSENYCIKLTKIETLHRDDGGSKL